MIIPTISCFFSPFLHFPCLCWYVKLIMGDSPCSRGCSAVQLEQAKKGRGLSVVATEMVREMLEFDEFEGSDQVLQELVSSIP